MFPACLAGASDWLPGAFAPCRRPCPTAKENKPRPRMAASAFPKPKMTKAWRFGREGSDNQASQLLACWIHWPVRACKAPFPLAFATLGEADHAKEE